MIKSKRIKKYSLGSWLFQWSRMMVTIYLIIKLLAINAVAVAFSSYEVQHDFLPVHEAFRFSGNIDKKDKSKAIIHINVKNGYYLYKDRIKIYASNPKIIIGKPIYPSGIEIEDPFQHRQMTIFPENTKVIIPLNTSENNIELTIKFQGCARAGLCYPPSITTINLNKVGTLDLKDKRAKTLKNNLEQAKNTASLSLHKKIKTDKPASLPYHDNKYFDLLNKQDNLFVVFGLFFIAGIFLAFTPCVLPMVPILSATLATSAGNRRRTIALSLSYIFFMSLTYAIAGILVGVFGETLNIQAWLQSPWVIGLFSLLFLMLACSMFGMYELQLPAWLRHKIMSADAHVSKKTKGSLVGAGFMGMCSALVVSPCITAPLVGALLYISSTQNAALGGLALFNLGLGMGVPLFVVGIGFGNCIPRSGAWLEKIKKLFGILMVGIAIWLISRIIPSYLVLIISGIFFLVLAVTSFLSFKLRTNSSLKYMVSLLTAGLIFFIYGASLITGGLHGNSNFIKPLASTAVAPCKQRVSNQFNVITSVQQLELLRKKAIKMNKPLILDFWANWCTACKIMDHKVFNNPALSSLLSRFTLVRFDLTKVTDEQTKFMGGINVFGAPTIILYGKSGKEYTRVVGEQNLTNFTKLLNNTLNENNKI